MPIRNSDETTTVWADSAPLRSSAQIAYLGLKDEDLRLKGCLSNASREHSQLNLLAVPLLQQQLIIPMVIGIFKRRIRRLRMNMVKHNCTRDWRTLEQANTGTAKMVLVADVRNKLTTLSEDLLARASFSISGPIPRRAE